MNMRGYSRNRYADPNYKKENDKNTKSNDVKIKSKMSKAVANILSTSMFVSAMAGNTGYSVDLPGDLEILEDLSE